jgi:rod shape-determining protein MreC
LPAYDKKSVRRRRATFAALVGLSLVLLTAYFGESAGGALHALQRGAQTALAPIEEGASRALKPFRDLVGWTGDVLSAKGDNEDLKEEVTRLRRDLARAQTDQREAAQLRSLVGLGRREGFPQGTDPVTARVIARSPTVWHSTIQIDKGRSDGVRADQPVISGEGLVGKVASVTGGTARVTLLTDDTSAVSAQVMPNGAGGIVKPELGKPNDLLLDFIQKKRRVTKGATVVTSGMTSSRFESLFPRGIPIGVVTRVDSDEIELYQRVHVRPFADLGQMDFVQVLTKRPEPLRASVGAP